MKPDCEEATPKQFLAIVGELNNEVRAALGRALKGDENARVLSIRNDYYRADVGVQQFANIRCVIEATKHEKVFPAVFINYRGTEQLATIASDLGAELDLKIDTKVITIDNEEISQAEFTDVEKWCVQNEFEAVNLRPSREHIQAARLINEKFGINRLVEILNICNWPKRHFKVNESTGKPQLDRLMRAINEIGDLNGEDEEEYAIDESLSESVWHSAQDMNPRMENVSTARPPSPHLQHAVRVHLPPDSPTGTETANGEDASISVDIELKSANPSQQNADDKTTNELGKETVIESAKVKN